MDSILAKIKRLVRRNRFALSEKARMELVLDNLQPSDAAESILNADRIAKVLRSRSPSRRSARELLYVIHGPNNRGTWIYTKGVIRGEGDTAVYYFLVSSKLLE